MDKRCENCAHWRGDTETPDERWSKWSSERDEPLFPPHANLQWGECVEAVEGWEDENWRPDLKMAVWDGSTYHAELLTRKDHVCGQWTPRE